MPIDQAQLSQFCGDEERYRHWTRRLIYTPGVKFVADNGGQSGAYWLLDAIASYQPDRRIRDNPKLREFQVWTLKVDLPARTAVLFCTDGDGEAHVIEQQIEHTDFDLAEVRFYVCEGDGERVLMLPNEY